MVTASPEHASALCGLFEAAGCSCYCRWWHFEGDDNAWQERSALRAGQSRAELQSALARGAPDARGVVAFCGEVVAGWLKLAPAAAMGKLYQRRVYRTLELGDRDDRLRTAVIGCLLVHPERRRTGVARALLRGAVDLAETWGAQAIEAMPRVSREPLRDDELWMGPVALYRELGFEHVAGPATYPVLRLTLLGHSATGLVRGPEM